MYLDELPLVEEAQVGYGEVGRGGELGYEEKRVLVQGQGYSHALSTHPPARLVFELGGKFGKLRCRVALNDDVAGENALADFRVLADGQTAGEALGVAVGELPRELEADLGGAQTLELTVSSDSWYFCHAIWLDPELEEIITSKNVLQDVLGRSEIEIPPNLPKFQRVIATTVSPGFESLLDDMLGSLYANGHCQDARLVIFTLGSSPACEEIIRRYAALAIPCRSIAEIGVMSKTILYSVARVIEAEQYLCLDADMLVLEDLSRIFAALETVPENSVLVCREGNAPGFDTLEEALRQIYGGQSSDFEYLGASSEAAKYPLVVNDGLFAGKRAALLNLDKNLREIPNAANWVVQNPQVWWRNQFIFNLALANLKAGLELNPVYNLQLQAQDVEISLENNQLKALWHGKHVRILHLNGQGRTKYAQWRGFYTGRSIALG